MGEPWHAACGPVFPLAKCKANCTYLASPLIGNKMKAVADKTFEWETQLRLFPYKTAGGAELGRPAMHRWTDMSPVYSRGARWWLGIFGGSRIKCNFPDAATNYATGTLAAGWATLDWVINNVSGAAIIITLTRLLIHPCLNSSISRVGGR